LPGTSWRVSYTDEFVTRYRELSLGQQRLVEESLRSLYSSDDPAALAHHLERASYFCNWSHRVRANLLIVFALSRKTITFVSTGTHAQAYRPTNSL
jgi:hypothetical protein